jgi:hypothetical protein
MVKDCSGSPAKPTWKACCQAPGRTLPATARAVIQGLALRLLCRLAESHSQHDDPRSGEGLRAPSHAQGGCTPFINAAAKCALLRSFPPLLLSCWTTVSTFTGPVIHYSKTSATKECTRAHQCSTDQTPFALFSLLVHDWVVGYCLKQSPGLDFPQPG